MSLLNDALRKKGRENLSPTNAAPKPSQKTVAQGRRRLFWLLGIGTVSLMAVAFIIGGRLYFFATGTGMTIASSPAAASVPENPGPPASSLARHGSAEITPASAASSSELPVPIGQTRPASVAAPPPTGETTRPAIPSVANTATPDEAPMSDPPAPSPYREDPLDPKSTDTGTAMAAVGAPRAGLDPPQPALSEEAQAERYYRKALSYHRQGRLRRAIALYRQTLQTQPLHFDACFNLVSAYIQIGEFTKAHRIAADLHRRDGSNQQVLANLAIAKIGLGQPREALQLLHQVSDLPPASLFTVYLHKGIAFRNLGQMDVALKWYKQAEDLEPDNPQVLFNLALVHDTQEHYADAVHYYQTYLRHGEKDQGKTANDIRRRIKTLRAYLAETAPEEQAIQ
jgi:Flp pilus assembly protein TadD